MKKQDALSLVSNLLIAVALSDLHRNTCQEIEAQVNILAAESEEEKALVKRALEFAKKADKAMGAPEITEKVAKKVEAKPKRKYKKHHKSPIVCDGCGQLVSSHFINPHKESGCQTYIRKAPLPPAFEQGLAAGS